MGKKLSWFFVGGGTGEGGWYLLREEYPAFPLGVLSQVLKRKGCEVAWPCYGGCWEWGGARSLGPAFGGSFWTKLEVGSCPPL